jgi:hypothetical protein
VIEDTPWIGGIPKDDWSGVINLVPESAFCYRFIDPKSQNKVLENRITSKGPKFKRDDPDYTLNAFGFDVLDHLTRHGLDTLFYINGLNIIQYHSKFTTDQVFDFVQECLGYQVSSPCGIGKVNSYSLQALKESGDYLWSCLDDTLLTHLRLEHPVRPVGPILWMAIVNEVQSTSLQQVSDLQDDFKNAQLSDFPGENVKDYCNHVLAILVQLEQEDQLPLMHLNTITSALSKASYEAFRFSWISKHAEVSKFIRASAGKDPAIIRTMKNYTNFHLLIAEAKLEFENHKKDWGKSHQAQAQLSAMQSQVSKLNNRVSQLTQVNQQLQQQAKPSSKKTPKAPAAGTTPEQQEKAARKAANKLKFAPPKDGEPHEKVINGKPMIWCTKCGRNKQSRWTFHTTKEHKDGFKPAPRKGRDHKPTGDGTQAHLHSVVPPIPPKAGLAVPPAPSAPATPGSAPSPTFTHLSYDLWTA